VRFTPCEIASDVAGTGQAMIDNEVAHTCTCRYKLAATDTLAQLHSDALPTTRLPLQAHRISEGRTKPG
jgi:hypothetical protein